MNGKPNKLVLLRLAILVALSGAIFACASNTATANKCLSGNWVAKSDASFAADCAEMAFKGTLKDRQTVAWMFFARINQLIADQQGVSNTKRVPQWMAWATDDDTFSHTPTFKFTQKNRDDLAPVTKKKVLAGHTSLSQPDGANEESVRNIIGYEYITKIAKLNTKQSVLDYINTGHTVDMPVGSIEIKASWLKVPPSGAPKGALTFKFNSGTYWWRGMHIMAKMQPLPKGEQLFYTEEPSWFWTTFEFNNNPGVAHVRDKLISQRAPLSSKEIDAILTKGGIKGFGFEAYAPNGTQIRYTENGTSETPIILGHTDMEDFAGAPNTAQPRYWASFNASCHSCHATAAINPTTKNYFPFSVPTGALTPQYNAATSASSPAQFLGEGFVPLDFMWPIAFHAQ